jgi:DNA-binding response OmpR family regulator
MACVYNGIDGKELLLRNEYDLVILDIKMPGINGVEVLKIAKEKKVKAKIIVVTGSFMVNKILKEGNIPVEGDGGTLLTLADCLVSKPFDIEQLLKRIKELIG